MNSRRLRHSIDEGDLHRFAAREDQHRPGNRTRIETSRIRAFQVDAVRQVYGVAEFVEGEPLLELAGD